MTRNLTVQTIKKYCFDDDDYDHDDDGCYCYDFILSYSTANHP